MKNLMWLVMAALLLTGCATSKKTSERIDACVRRDSVVRVDSVRIRDSVVTRREKLVRDSVVVKDSVVVTVDAEGKVVKSERYRQTERNREQTQALASERRHDESEQGTAAAMSSEAQTHWAAKSEKKEAGLPWYAWAVGLVVALGLWGIVWYYVLVREKK